MNNFQCKYIPNIAGKVSTLKKKNSAHCSLKFKFQWVSYVFPSNSIMPVSHTKAKFFLIHLQFSSVQFSYSVLSDSLQPHRLQHARPPCPSPTPGVYPNSYHWVSDAIQPSHPLSSSSPLTFNLSQHQGLFQWVSSSHQVAKVLEFQLQHPSFQWIFRTDFL